MRAVVQRVRRARVTVDGAVAGEIGHGLVVLLGVKQGDDAAAARYMAEKVATLRIFDDEEGRMNRSVLDVAGGVLAVSQFTLYGDARGQRRPSYIQAARPEAAEPLYAQFCQFLRGHGLRVATGVFRAAMQVELVNDGPVTILLDSDKRF